MECVLHTHTVAGVAGVGPGRRTPAGVAAVDLPAVVGRLSRLRRGVALRADEKPRLVRDLGDSTYLYPAQSRPAHVGPTIADAYLYMYTLQRACEIQIAAQAGRPAPDDRTGHHRDRDGAGPRRHEGRFGQIVWPGALRRLARHFPGWDR